jgi:phage-related protein
MVLGLVGGLMGDSYEEVMSKLTETWDFVSQSFSDFITGLTEWISNIGENITQLWSDIKDWFTDGITNAMDALSGWWDEISEWFTNLADNGLEWAGDLIDNFVSGLMGGISRVGDAVSGIADEVRSFLGFSEPEQGSLSNFHTFAPDMIDLFSQGIDESIPTLERSLSNMSDFVADNMPTLDMADITSNATVNVDSAGNASNQPIVVQAYFGNEKFDEYVIDSNQRSDFISGGRA